MGEKRQCLALDNCSAEVYPGAAAFLQQTLHLGMTASFFDFKFAPQIHKQGYVPLLTNRSHSCVAPVTHTYMFPWRFSVCLQSSLGTGILPLNHWWKFWDMEESSWSRSLENKGTISQVSRCSSGHSSGSWLSFPSPYEYAREMWMHTRRMELSPQGLVIPARSLTLGSRTPGKPELLISQFSIFTDS